MKKRYLDQKEQLKLKERLIREYETEKINRVVLINSHFGPDRRLLPESYEILKNKVKHINVKEEIVIELPTKRKMIEFKPILEEYIANEIVDADKEIAQTLKQASLLLFSGICVSNETSFVGYDSTVPLIPPYLLSMFILFA